MSPPVLFFFFFLILSNYHCQSKQFKMEMTPISVFCKLGKRLQLNIFITIEKLDTLKARTESTHGLPYRKAV